MAEIKVTEDYCSFETAKLLKEKGFDQNCTTYYLDGQVWHHYHGEVIPKDKQIYAAPTQAIAMKWLREVHNLHVDIDPHFGKPIDKVEPKFHEGQWIVWQGKYLKVSYNGCEYELTDQNGESMLLEYGAVDKTANPWRIQDAKAGDVLYSPKDSVVECIVLIGGWKLLDGYSSLCAAITYRVKENEIKTSPFGAIWWSGVINSFCPATKLQRDILFQKMKGAGYEWDDKIKHLRR